MELNLSVVLQNILNFAVLWGIILAISSLLRKTNDKTLSYLFIGVVVSKILSLTFITLSNYGIKITSPFVRSIVSTFPFLIGPFYYLYLAYALNILKKITVNKFYHFIQMPVVFIIIFTIISNNRFKGGSEPYNKFVLILYLLQIFHILSYYFYIIVLMLQKQKNEKYLKIGLYLTAAYSLTFIVSGSSILFLDDTSILLILSTAYTYDVLVMTIHYFLSHHYPQLMPLFLSGQKDSQYLLDDEEIDAIDNRLIKLMDDEKIYLYEDLSLNMLAYELNIKPYQLSLYLNKYRKINFYSLINKYRIEEAKKQLVEYPDKNVLTIAFDAGFNSKASFNRVFSKYVNMTPSQYRELFFRKDSTI